MDNVSHDLRSALTLILAAMLTALAPAATAGDLALAKATATRGANAPALRAGEFAWRTPGEIVAPAATQKQAPRKRARKPQIGKASYYAKRFNGRRTASGHLYYQDAYTAAHRTLPLGTWVRVTNLRNQRWVVVQITDRGPYAGSSRIIDLSRRSADELAMIDSGVVQVRVEVLDEQAGPTPEASIWDSPIAAL